MTKYLIFGSSSQLGKYLSFHLRIKGYQFEGFSKSLNSPFTMNSSENLKIFLSKGNKVVIYWLQGLTRPSDKNTNLLLHLEYGLSDLLSFIKQFSEFKNQIHFNFTGSILQFKMDHNPLKDDSYVIVKNLTSRLIIDNFNFHTIWILGNNEGLLRPYDHWLQTLFINMKNYNNSKNSDIIKIDIDSTRELPLNLTYEVADSMVSYDYFIGTNCGVFLASRHDSSNIKSLIMDFCTSYNCSIEDIGVSFVNSDTVKPKFSLDQLPQIPYFKAKVRFGLSDINRMIQALKILKDN